MLSLAANDPNRLVICTADSSGAPTLRSPAGGEAYIDLSSPACGGGQRGGGVGSSMRGTAWGTCCVLWGRCRCRDGGRRLIANFGETDRAGQTGDIVVAEADLAQRAGKARALGGAANHPHIGKPTGQQSSGCYVEVEG